MGIDKDTLKNTVNRTLRKGISGSFCSRARRSVWGLSNTHSEFKEQLNKLDSRLDQLYESTGECNISFGDEEKNSTIELLEDIDRIFTNLSTIFAETTIKCNYDWTNERMVDAIGEYGLEKLEEQLKSSDMSDFPLKQGAMTPATVLKASLEKKYVGKSKAEDIHRLLTTYDEFSYPIIMDKTSRFYSHVNKAHSSIKRATQSIINDRCYIMTTLGENR